MNPHFLFNALNVLAALATFAPREIPRAAGRWLEMSVSDDGQGIPSQEVEQIFFAERPQVHALVLLRRRLQGLFGCSFRLEVDSDVGQGTTVTLRIPRGHGLR